MTAPECATGCGRPSPSALICGECVTALRGSLELAASIEPDLLDAVARQLRHGGGKSASAEPPLPYDPAASDARRALAVALGEAVYAIMGDEYWPIANPSISGMARWLLAHMTQLASYPYAARDHAAITAAVARCAMVLDPPPERHPAGDCDSCGRPLLADAHADEARCACGMVTTGIMASRAERAAEADLLGEPTAISRALRDIGIAVPAGTIRSWASRGRLGERPGGVYAMSEVLALKAESDARRAG